MNVSPPPVLTPLMSERRVSLIGALLVAVGPLSMALFTPAMPELVRDFGTTEAAVKMTLSFYFAGFAVAQLFCGPLSDGFGRKPVTIGFMVIYLAATLLAVLAPDIEALIAARLLQGVGAAVGVAIARALVRDMFTNERSARIMNLMGLILGVGPAFAPTLGGLTMELFGWQAIFLFMAALGLAIILVVRYSMVETVARDLSRIRPLALLRTYRQLLTDRYFMLCSIILGGGTGTIYTLATVLPFILMDRVGLTPTEFGIGMLFQSGSFVSGSIVVRVLMQRVSAFRLVPAGMVFVGLGSLGLAIGMPWFEPSFLAVMGPVALFAFGLAFVTPAMSTAALAGFPHIAGAASSLSGFFQMGGGLLGGVAAALIGDPMVAVATVIPAMGFAAIGAWLLWKRLPAPVVPLT